jgi:hypothetical protein
LTCPTARCTETWMSGSCSGVRTRRATIKVAHSQDRAPTGICCAPVARGFVSVGTGHTARTACTRRAGLLYGPFDRNGVCRRDQPDRRKHGITWTPALSAHSA